MRFNFATPTTDPVTSQIVGINLTDTKRVDAYGSANRLTGYQPSACNNQTAAETGKCLIFATGGVSFMWEGATANQIVRLKGPASNNLRLSVVKAK
jgi:hypothetical protein